MPDKIITNQNQNSPVLPKDWLKISGRLTSRINSPDKVIKLFLLIPGKKMQPSTLIAFFMLLFSLQACVGNPTLVQNPAAITIDFTKATSDGGFAYIIDSSSFPESIKLFENGVEIGPANSVHEDIRTLGKGRFSLNGTRLRFSASDNSNPASNGKKYSFLAGTSSVTEPAPEPTPEPTPEPEPTPSPTVIDISKITSDGGFAYIIDSSSFPPSIKLFENGVEIGPANSVHEDIRTLGKGRFSLKGTRLRFSASDNSNPASNGKKYSFLAGTSSVTEPLPEPTPEPEPEPAPTPGTGPISLDDTPNGYAMINGQTTGGAGGKTVTVKTAAELKDAVANSNTPAIVYVSGTLTGSGITYVKSNKTIIGLPGATTIGISLSIYGQQNVIIRNLTMKNALTYSNIIIKNGSHHVWVDHCDLSSERTEDWDLYDGLLDIGNASDYVTVSWNKLHDNHKPMLIGFAPDSYEDRGKLHVTVHNNFFYNVSERQPRVRFGNVHFYNNYILNSNGYAMGAVLEAEIRTDNNYFENVSLPMRTIINTESGGFIGGVETNIFKNSGANQISTPPSTWLPPYEYKSMLLPAASVPEALIKNAGPTSLK